MCVNTGMHVTGFLKVSSVRGVAVVAADALS